MLPEDLLGWGREAGPRDVIPWDVIPWVQSMGNGIRTEFNSVK
ncbi:Hypothetical protein CpPa08_1971 [Corynebacterium pseudotuberculosis]|nr:hypothetical protein CpPA04_2024 [Corynebacterium pseudotuberculosis]ATQ66329.1 Hypothetical protein CpPA07_2049 [Corynebacterium pseudotuberculosis]ATQ82237.1 Hypothetical protein CpPa08_1971 [Corynebacterium pseudotuberculosis]QBG76874.1 Hypothetical protein CpCAP1R_0646 [Corynebacterium pseudotuberculosis]QBI72582.1 Hypothetical protein Cp38MAT_0653 [Corynebacterium pseudotuberculosis]